VIIDATLPPSPEKNPEDPLLDYGSDGEIRRDGKVVSTEVPK
jgi:hypothetical protein